MISGKHLITKGCSYTSFRLRAARSGNTKEYSHSTLRYEYNAVLAVEYCKDCNALSNTSSSR